MFYVVMEEGCLVVEGVRKVRGHILGQGAGGNSAPLSLGMSGDSSFPILISGNPPADASLWGICCDYEAGAPWE